MELPIGRQCLGGHLLEIPNHEVVVDVCREADVLWHTPREMLLDWILDFLILPSWCLPRRFLQVALVGGDCPALDTHRQAGGILPSACLPLLCSYKQVDADDQDLQILRLQIGGNNKQGVGGERGREVLITLLVASRGGSA